jgi:ABC-type nitrate/sulfonate/bicarbonate transport system permease component
MGGDDSTPAARAVVITHAPARGTKRAGSRPEGRVTRHLPVLLSWGIGLILWEVVGRISSKFVFASFTDTLSAFWELLRSGTLLEATRVSMIELSIGFTIGSVIGILGGTAAGLSRLFRQMTEHWITVLLAVPFAAVFPIFLLWFGLGLSSKIALAVFACFIPAWINTATGISSVDPQLVEMTRSFGGGWRHVLRLVIFPWALPSLIEGLRMGLGRAFLGVIIGELLASREGLGFLITLSGTTLRMDNLLAAVLTVTLITLGLTSLMRMAQRIAVPWWSQRSTA